jgi:hypothetical protein
LPTGVKVNIAQGSLNDRGDVAFSSNTGNLYFEQDGGVYIRSGGQTQKIVAVGDPTPIGGKFAPFGKVDEFYQVPRISNNGAVAFKAAIKNGASASGIFLASPNAIVKVVATGDRVDGGKIASFDTYAMNGLGDIAFVAFDKNRRVLGVFKATAADPAINSIKLKRKANALELRVNGAAMIGGDSVIEIDGVRLGAIEYPPDFREDGGLTTRVVSRDTRLEELIPFGRTALVTVFNPLTGKRSAAVAFAK